MKKLFETANNETTPYHKKHSDVEMGITRLVLRDAGAAAVSLMLEDCWRNNGSDRNNLRAVSIEMTEDQATRFARAILSQYGLKQMCESCDGTGTQYDTDDNREECGDCGGDRFYEG